MKFADQLRETANDFKNNEAKKTAIKAVDLLKITASIAARLGKFSIRDSDIQGYTITKRVIKLMEEEGFKVIYDDGSQEEGNMARREIYTFSWK